MGGTIAQTILGRDFQSMISKVFWTWVQAFGGVLLVNQGFELDLTLFESAAGAGFSAAIVPITVYARQMAGDAVLRRSRRNGQAAAEDGDGELPPLVYGDEPAPGSYDFND